MENEIIKNEEDLESENLEEDLKKRRLIFWIVFIILMLAISGLIFNAGFF